MGLLKVFMETLLRILIRVGLIEKGQKKIICTQLFMEHQTNMYIFIFEDKVYTQMCMLLAWWFKKMLSNTMENIDGII